MVDIHQIVRREIDSNRKIVAIQLYREYGYSFKKAYEMVCAKPLKTNLKILKPFSDK